MIPSCLWCYWGGGEAAINVLLVNGGMKEWQKRLRSRAETPCIAHWPMGHDRTRRMFQEEERLHARDFEDHLVFQVVTMSLAKTTRPGHCVPQAPAWR